MYKVIALPALSLTIPSQLYIDKTKNDRSIPYMMAHYECKWVGLDKGHLIKTINDMVKEHPLFRVYRAESQFHVADADTIKVFHDEHTTEASIVRVPRTPEDFFGGIDLLDRPDFANIAVRSGDDWFQIVGDHRLVDGRSAQLFFQQDSNNFLLENY